MKKTKFDTRIKNAMNAFFENDEQFENNQIVLNNNCSALLQDQPEKEATEKIDSIISLVKLVFLFLPAAFFLYKLSLTFVYYSMFEGVGFVSYGGDSKLQEFLFLRSFLQPLLGTFFLLAASFMTFIGVGSLKETKNLVVPGSIISFSLLLGVLFSFLNEPLRGHVVIYYSIYLFPLVLVIAGLIKHWVNKNDVDSNQ